MFCFVRNSFFPDKWISEEIVQKALLIGLCDWKKNEKPEPREIETQKIFSKKLMSDGSWQGTLAMSDTGRKLWSP